MYPGDRVIDIEQAVTAAERFKENEPPFADEVAILAPEEHDPRKEYLKQALTFEKAKATVSEAESNGAVRDSGETLASLAHERIIGSNDMRDINYLELAIAIARSVCRIRIGNGAGTGVLIGPGLLMTNNHVLRSEDDARIAEAQFDYQENVTGDLLPVQKFKFDPGTFFVTNKKLDYSIVALSPTSAKGTSISAYPWNMLIATLGKAEKGDPINIIQHPRGGLKQIAIRNNEVTVLTTGDPNFLYYTTDTEPGSSGSPCFNDQWELIALHHSGVPEMNGDTILDINGNPWDKNKDDPAMIKWIANEGARVSAIVASLSAESLEGKARDLRDMILNGNSPNPIELARGNVNSVSAPQNVNSGLSLNNGGSVSFSVPLNITVSLGDAGSQIAAAKVLSRSEDEVKAIPSIVSDSLTEKLIVDPNWQSRTGYDKDFLDIRVPLPTLSTPMKAKSVEVPTEFRVNGERHVLAYHHYSLAMNKDRRFAWYSAANIDGKVRPQLPDRKNDEWHIDPRIDDPKNPKFQCGEDLYSAKNTDRGHLTRYLDVAWGTESEALNALADTFHFTNCCLQLDSFNQRTARWQGIEQFLLERKAKKDKMRISVITGPIFRDDDPKYKNPKMSSRVRIPVEFWKVCALIRDDGSLSATAFILPQEDITNLPGFEAFLNVSEVQTTIANVESLTGLTFPVLRDNDHLGAGGQAGTLEISGQTVIPISSYDDIVV